MTALASTPSCEWFVVRYYQREVYYINRWLGQEYVKLLGSFGDTVVSIDVASAFAGSRIAIGTERWKVYYIDKSLGSTIKLATLNSPIRAVDMDINAEYVVATTDSGMHCFVNELS